MAISGQRDDSRRQHARLVAEVRGRVQGVGFRAFALREAMRLDLHGSVSNERNGSVNVIAEGPRADLEMLLERLEDGPPAALVERVIVHWEPARGLRSGFWLASGGHPGD
jgi:acylphosphatase